MPPLQYLFVFCWCSFIEHLDNLDKKIFLFLNQFHHDFIDYVMFAFTNKYFWIPIYAIVLFVFIKKYRWHTLKILLIIAIVITLSDQISSSFIKPAVGRYRPCHNLELKEKVHTFKGKCGGIYGFVSSHASNSVALAIVIVFFLRKKVKNIAWYASIYVVLVSYSRIYLGVHYPFDIIGGLIIGSIVSLLILLIYSGINKFILANNGLNENN